MVPGVAFETVPRIPGDQHSGDEFTGTEPLAARVSVLPEIDARFASLGRRRKLHFVPSASFSKLSDLLGRAKLRRIRSPPERKSHILAVDGGWLAR